MRRMRSTAPRWMRHRGRGALVATLAACALSLTAPQAVAEKIENPVAVFSGLDKITGRIITFDVYIGETVQFGALQVTPRECNTRPQTETPQTTAFVEVDEITLENQVQRIFTGWMFAASPGLHAVEHAVYDVWLTDCKQYSNVPPPDNYSGPPISEQAAAGEDPLAGTAPEQGPQGVLPRLKPPQ